jgi:hypothetical protein
LDRREEEFFAEDEGSRKRLDSMEDHYKSVYKLHSTEVKDFFSIHAPEALFVGQLEDPDKWKKLGNFLGVDVPDGYVCHKTSRNLRKLDLVVVSTNCDIPPILRYWAKLS